MMERVIVVVGPTGVGKTKMGVALAKYFNGEVIVEIQCKFIKLWILELLK